MANESIAYEPNGDASRVALDALVQRTFPHVKMAMHTFLRELEAEPETGGLCHAEDRSLHVMRRRVVRLNLFVLLGARVGGVDGEDADRISCIIGFTGIAFARRMGNPLKVYVDWRRNFSYRRDVGVAHRAWATPL